MSLKVARLNDYISGTTSGEHSGHTESPHSSSAITGSINGGCVSSVLVNNKPIAVLGSTTVEYDSCCGTSSGKVANTSTTVFANKKGVARTTDKIQPHNGTAKIVGCSPNVFSN